jgi:hypothetical protein
MNLNMLKAVIKPFLPAFQGYLSQMSNPVEDGGYLQPGDNMVGLTIYADASGIQIAAMSYRFESSPEQPPVITVTAINSLGNFEMLK